MCSRIGLEGELTAHYDEAGRLTFPAYDFKGNLLSEGTSRHHEWDHANRLKVYRTQTSDSEPSDSPFFRARKSYFDSGIWLLKHSARSSGIGLTPIWVRGCQLSP